MMVMETKEIREKTMALLKKDAEESDEVTRAQEIIDILNQYIEHENALTDDTPDDGKGSMMLMAAVTKLSDLCADEGADDDVSSAIDMDVADCSDQLREILDSISSGD